MSDGGDEEAGADVDPRVRPIEPGRPKAENVTFVVLGAVVTILAFLRGLGLI